MSLQNSCWSPNVTVLESGQMFWSKGQTFMAGLISLLKRLQREASLSVYQPRVGLYSRCSPLAFSS